MRSRRRCGSRSDNAIRARSDAMQICAAEPRAPVPEAQEVVFAGERCLDERRLKHYGVCENWIIQARSLQRLPTLESNAAGRRLQASWSTAGQLARSTSTACSCRSELRSPTMTCILDP